ncbi:hypothetical protein WJ97_14535 [Burkholderia ubonensis]|uniref:hypothetical protein n=1 Tax=Burkholderia ubonensis TaxID=101571 RepID=UPI00075B4B16|nr:hypothetical protein [Burkholderia ubonensis]KVP97033.1 hypothetical protein WJ97_14535 [Burkholderia ubonensis]
MTSLSWTDDANTPSLGLRSLLTAREGFFSSNPTLVAGELKETPLQMVSVVMLELHDQRHSRWVLLEQDPGVDCASQWKFPGGVIPAGAMPLPVALRAVTENICLLEAGLPVSWRGLQYRVLSVGLEWLTELSVPAGAHHVDYENILVFSYHARMRVDDIYRVELQDLKTRPGRHVLLAGILDIQNLISDGTLCSASDRLWKAYWSRAGS